MKYKEVTSVIQESTPDSLDAKAAKAGLDIFRGAFQTNFRTGHTLWSTFRDAPSFIELGVKKIKAPTFAWWALKLNRLTQRSG